MTSIPVSPDIAVTGLGTIGAYGSGAESLRRALASGLPLSASEVDRSSGYHLARASRQMLLVDPALAREWLSPAEARRMSPPSKLAVAASRMALRCAGLEAPAEEPAPGAGVALATAFGPSSFSEGLLRQILLEGPEAASPFLFTESVANAPAAQIAIASRARGPSLTLCQREAGALLAVGQGAADVAAGRAARVLAGSVDEMTPLLHALLDRFGAVTRSGVDGREQARPFDLRRSGFVAAEGATMLVLESGAAARSRGAAVLARVLAWGSAFDPSAPAIGWGTGHAALGRALRRSLNRAGIGIAGIAGIDRIVAGASGSVGGDRLEALMLREAWGDLPLPPVLAPKGVTGEYGGGFLGAVVLAASGAVFGPAAGFAEMDPDLGLVPHDGSPLPAPSLVLATSVAAGGAASWLVLGAPRP